MTYRRIELAITAVLLAAAGPALADHNSNNGEGWANMPNDIHNTRVETLENGDSDAFREFVKYGEGSDSVNRFDSQDTQPNRAAEHGATDRMPEKQGRTGVKNRDENATRTAANEHTRTEMRSRFERGNSAAPQRSRGATSRRGGSSQRTGGRR